MYYESNQFPKKKKIKRKYYYTVIDEITKAEVRSNVPYPVAKSIQNQKRSQGIKTYIKRGAEIC